MHIFPTDPWLRAEVSARSDGNMRIAAETPTEARTTREGVRQAFLARAGMPTALVTPYLVHGGRVTVVTAESAPFPIGTDALITDALALTIGVTVADCIPVFLADPVHRAIGVAHAGWRGMLADIVGRTVAAMSEAFGTSPKDLHAAIGPCIGPCHFEVGDDVFGKFPDARLTYERDGRTILAVDLPGACSNALIAAGVPPMHLQMDGSCTACEPERFFSHRRGRQGDEAMLAAIAIKESS